MELYTNKIKKFSRIIYVFLRVTFVILIVAAVLELLAWLWVSENWPTTTMMINGVEVAAPLLFQIGSVKVVLPFAWENRFVSILGMGSAFSAVTFGDFLATLATIVGVSFAKKVFILLKDDGSPFRLEIVQAMKRLAIALLVTGFFAGVLPLLAAGVVWVLCLIFGYGHQLQSESDTTL